MIITLKWTNLSYEIDQETWKGAKVRITGDENAEILNEAQSSTNIDTFDKNYCFRKIEQGIMNMQDIMHKFFVGYTREGGAPFHVGDIVAYTASGASAISGYEVIKVEGTSASTYRFDIKKGTTVVETVTASQLTMEDNLGADNELDNVSTKWQVTLEFDGRRNINPTLLASEMHKYVVLNVLQEWAKMAIPTMAEDYYNRLIIEANRLRAIVYRKETPELS